MRFEFGNRTLRTDGAVGIDHVRLGYDYLDRGDLDGYASLLAAGVVLDEPGQQLVRGREAVCGARRAGSRTGGVHTVHVVRAGAGWAIALGRFERRGRSVEFADVFTISGSGLLLTQKCYYFLEYEGEEGQT